MTQACVLDHIGAENEFCRRRSGEFFVCLKYQGFRIPGHLITLPCQNLFPRILSCHDTYGFGIMTDTDSLAAGKEIALKTCKWEKTHHSLGQDWKQLQNPRIYLKGLYLYRNTSEI
jgi:hypothetical protein